MTLRALWDVPAPAKINLFLHIVGRRDDGYHLLQSVFALVDWADALHFELRNDGRISRQDLISDAPPLPEHDLVVRAAQALQQATGCTLGAHIALDKHLPMEAGMGGGSTDAASTLLALNRLWKLNLPLHQLLAIGLQLGADVPFFLGGRNAWVEGIGESLHPIDLPTARLLIVKPPKGAPTPKIFQSPSLKRDTKRSIIEDFVANDAERTFGYGKNDLQPVAELLCPEITSGLKWMKHQGLQARMTGSGSALFAKVAHDVDTSTLPPDWIAKHCNILNEHPLIGWQ